MSRRRGRRDEKLVKALGMLLELGAAAKAIAYRVGLSVRTVQRARGRNTTNARRGGVAA